MRSIAVAALTLALVLPAVASAQSGLAGSLGDPTTGQSPTVRRPPPSDSESELGSAGHEPSRGRVVVGAVAVPNAPGSAAADGGVSTRLRVLDATFQVLATRGGPDYLGSVLSLLGGAAAIVFGALFLETGAPFDRLSPYIITLGTTTIIRTVLVDFILRPDARSPAIEYQRMSSGNAQERLERLELGERQLEWLAKQFFIARIVDASLNLTGALAIIPAYLIPREFMVDDPLEAFIFIGPAISLVGAIVTLASPSPAEQRWDAYRQMRRRLGGDDETAFMLPAPSIQMTGGFAIDPQGGGVGTISGRF